MRFPRISFDPAVDHLSFFSLSSPPCHFPQFGTPHFSVLFIFDPSLLPVVPGNCVGSLAVLQQLPVLTSKFPPKLFFYFICIPFPVIFCFFQHLYLKQEYYYFETLCYALHHHKQSILVAAFSS